MSTITVNQSLLLSSTSKYLFFKRYYFESETYPKLLQRNRPPLVLKCSNNNKPEEKNLSGASNRSFKDALSGMVDKQVEELLNREENRGLLDGLEKASLRVEMAKRELAQIERQEIEAKQMRDYINQLEIRSSEIAECQREILEARALVEEADVVLETESERIDRDKERWESVKAASIAAFVGALAGLPISLTQVTAYFELILPLAINFISCALFGVTFRYTVRRDLDNFQLKTGTSAAFAFVKGLATMGGGLPLELNPGSLWSHAFDGATFVSENLLIFAFAAIGLDFCFKMRLLSPFPIRAGSSKADMR